MISDPTKIQSWSEYGRSLAGEIIEEKFSKILQTDFRFPDITDNFFHVKEVIR